MAENDRWLRGRIIFCETEILKEEEEARIDAVANVYGSIAVTVRVLQIATDRLESGMHGLNLVHFQDMHDKALVAAAELKSAIDRYHAG